MVPTHAHANPDAIQHADTNANTRYLTYTEGHNHWNRNCHADTNADLECYTDTDSHTPSGHANRHRNAGFQSTYIYTNTVAHIHTHTNANPVAHADPYLYPGQRAPNRHTDSDA